MNMRTVATSVYVATNGYIWYVALDMLDPVQRNVGFSISLFLFLVAFYRRKGVEQVVSKTITPQSAAQKVQTARAGQSYAQPPTQAALGDEMRVIAKCLQSLKIAVKPVSAKSTPDYEIYHLSKSPETPWSKITEAVLDEIGTAVYLARNGGEPVSVRFNKQPPYLLVTSRQRLPLPWSNRLLSLPAYTGQAGAYLDGTDLRPLKIDLTDTDQATVGVFAASGGGKSMNLRAIALSAIENADPKNTDVFLIDLDSNQYAAWKRLPHVRLVASTEDQALAIINWFYGQIEMDYNLTNRTRRILIIDELQKLTSESDNADEFITLLGKIAQQGRKHLHNLITATQDPSGTNYPKPIQRNTKVFLAGLTPDCRYLNNELKIEGAEKLRGKGDFIAKMGSRQINYKGFLLTDADIERTIDAIVQRWGENKNLMRFGDEEPAQAPQPEPVKTPEPPPPPTPSPSPSPAVETIRTPESKVKRTQAAIDAEKIRERLDEAYDFELGKLRTGYAAELLELIYGEPKANAGGYAARLNNAVNHAVSNFY